MMDSSTSQSNPNFLPEAESSAIPLGVHNPLLTPHALGQGQFSAGLIPLGNRRITVLDPSFFQRKPILQEGPELNDSDSFLTDISKSAIVPESLISSSSLKIQRSSLPRIQSQESLPLICNSDQNSLLLESSVDSSNLSSDSTNVLDITSLDQDLGHAVGQVEIESDLNVFDQQIQRFAVKEVLDSTQNTIRPESIVESNKSDIEDQDIYFPISVEQVELLPLSSTIDLQFKLEVGESAQVPIAIESVIQTTKPQVQRSSVAEDSDIVQRQAGSFQPEPQSPNYDVETDRLSTPIQRSTSLESTNQNLSVQPLSNLARQFKLESQEINQISTLIQRRRETDVSSQTDSVESVNNMSTQEIQRFSVIEDSNSSQVQINSSQPEQSPANCDVETHQLSTSIQRSTSLESTNQNLSVQPLSNVNIQLKQESGEPNSIPRHSEINTHSQINSAEETSIESVIQTTKQEVQRFSATEDSDIMQRQVSSFQAEPQSLNNDVEPDRLSTPIQRSTSLESTNQNLSVQPLSNVARQFKLESQEINQISTLIQRRRETDVSSQTDSVKSVNNMSTQEIQRFSVIEDSNSSQVQINSSQPEQSPANCDVETHRLSTSIQRSTSLESTNQNLSVQPLSNVNIQLKQESGEPNSIPRHSEINTHPQINSAEETSIESVIQTTKQEVQRFSATEDSDIMQRQFGSFQAEPQSLNNDVEPDRLLTPIQRSTISPYPVQDLGQSATKSDDTSSSSTDTIKSEGERHDQTIQKFSTIEGSDVRQTKINLPQSVDQEADSWSRNNQYSIENQPSNSLLSEDKALYSQLSKSIDLQFKLKDDTSNLLPNLIQRSQESPSSSPIYSNVSKEEEDILEIFNDRIDTIPPKSENHISDGSIQRYSAIEIPDQMLIGSPHLDIQSISSTNESSPSVNRSSSSNIIERMQEPSFYKAQSIDSNFPIEKSSSKSLNEPTSSVNISIQDNTTIDQDYIQRSSLSESQSEQPEFSATVQQAEIEKLPNILKEISILKPLIQPCLQLSTLDISNTPQKLDPEPLNVWSTILQPRSQSHSSSSKADYINSSSHSENSDPYHVINPSNPYNLNTESDISLVTNSPQEWSSLESLVQMNSELQKGTLQRKSSESYPQIISSQSVSNRDISNQINIARQETSIQRNTSPFSSSVESDQEYVEINSDRNLKLDREKIVKSEHFEALAQEIYLLLRQRLVIDQERQGCGYSGRLPW